MQCFCFPAQEIFKFERSGVRTAEGGDAFPSSISAHRLAADKIVPSFKVGGGSIIFSFSEALLNAALAFSIAAAAAKTAAVAFLSASTTSAFSLFFFSRHFRALAALWRCRDAAPLISSKLVEPKRQRMKTF